MKKKTSYFAKLGDMNVLVEDKLSQNTLAAGIKRFDAHVKQNTVDLEERTLEAVISTSQVDTEGEVIVQSGIDITAYMKNPVILHNHWLWDTPIGKIISIRRYDDRTEATIQFVSEDEDEFGYKIFKLYAGGYMNAFSIGFHNAAYEFKEDATYVISCKLHEVSCVTVGMNDEALSKSVKDGVLSEKEAVSYLEHIKKEIDRCRGKKDGNKEFATLNSMSKEQTQNTGQPDKSELENSQARVKELESELEQKQQEYIVENHKLTQENEELDKKVKSLEEKNTTLTKVIAAKMAVATNNEGEKEENDESDLDEEVSDEKAQEVFQDVYERTLKE